MGQTNTMALAHDSCCDREQKVSMSQLRVIAKGYLL